MRYPSELPSSLILPEEAIERRAPLNTPTPPRDREPTAAPNSQLDPRPSFMERRSTVQVRQRALQKPRTWALSRFLVQVDLLRVDRAVGMEPLMELSG
jgi:hypothetical protein